MPFTGIPFYLSTGESLTEVDYHLVPGALLAPPTTSCEFLIADQIVGDPGPKSHPTFCFCRMLLTPIIITGWVLR